MRMISRFSVIIVVLLASMVMAAQGQKEPPLGPFVPGELLVRFKTDIYKSAIDQIHAVVGASLLQNFAIVPNLQLVRVPASMNLLDALKLYKKNPNVLYAEPNYIQRITQHSLLTPNDSQYSQLWALHNTGQTGGTPDADIDAPEAWEISTGSNSVVVAVIDTGVDYNHPDLSANMWRNTLDCNSNSIDDDGNGYKDDCYGIDTANNDSNPMDDHNHGTHVAGTIGARGNNAAGVVGVNWQVQIMACKFLNAGGSGTTAGAIACLQYVKSMKERGVNIIATNNSWGGGGFSQALYDAIVENMNAGILFIAAAGNSSANNDTGDFYPANYYLPNVIAVAATTHTDALASFSNFGQYTVHVGAPGNNILSTTRNNTYSTFSGTSMATPHVTGLAALLKAQDPTRDWKALRNLILASGDAKPSLRGKTVSGRRINAYGALTCADVPLFGILQPTAGVVGGGAPVTLAVLNINCAMPAGPLTATIIPGGTVIPLEDNGTAPDLAAGDGIYTGTWTPEDLCRVGAVTLEFSNGHSVNLQVGGAMGTYGCTTLSDDWRTITGTNLNLGDDSSATITLPFSVRFGSQSFSSVRIGANGAVSFHQSTISQDNGSLPSRSFTTLVAPFWDDLYPSGSNNVYWETLGSAPNRELVIEWRNVRHYNCRTDASATVRFQIVFFESKNDVLFHYRDVLFGGNCAIYDNGRSASVGVQVSATDATQIGFQAPILSDGLTVHWATAAGPQADLALQKTSAPNPLAVGSTLTYTLTITNRGPSSATEVTLSDPLPPGVNFLSATASQGTCANSTNTVTCMLNTLLSGASATVTIAVTPTVATTITNTASVTAAESDPDLSNNSAAASTTVTASGCTGLAVSSKPSSVTYKPTATRSARATIRVIFTNNSGATRTVTNIVPQAGEPFTIVRTRPQLPLKIPNRYTYSVYVYTERAAGLGTATATRPYFEISVDCGLVTTASEPRLGVPLQITGISAEVSRDGLLLTARGVGIASVQLQLFDLSGRVVASQERNDSALVIPFFAAGRPLANGVYLYIVEVRGYGGQAWRSEVRKLVVRR